MKKTCLFLLGVIAVLPACQTTSKMAWQYYDECASQHSKFQEMVACGKHARNMGCVADNTCGERGNALVRYSDSLVASIKLGELSEPEAQRKWIEYRTAEENAYIQDVSAERARLSAINSSQALRDAVAQQSTPIFSPRPVNCVPLGAGFSCF